MECITAGNLMVQLFLQTKPRYELNNKKLQYLLCAAQMLSLSSGRSLFEDSFRNLKFGFVIEAIADSFACNSYIVTGKCNNKKIALEYEDFQLPFAGPKLYEVKEVVSEEDKRILVEAFVRFGACREDVLVRLLNEFAPLRNRPVLSYISPDDISEYFKKTFSAPNESSSGMKKNVLYLLCKKRFREANKPKEPVEQPAETPAEPTPAAVEPLVVPPAEPVRRVGILEPFRSENVKRMVVGKKYSVYIETKDSARLKDVELVSLKNNCRVAGDLKKVRENLYHCTFVGMAADAKVIVSTRESKAEFRDK